MNNYQKKKNKKEQTMDHQTIKNQSKKKIQNGPVQQEEEYTETTYGRFIHW